MKIILTDSYNEMSFLAAKEVKEFIEKSPSGVLGCATGRTPMGMYEYLRKFHKEEGLDFSAITSFNLDEYVGLNPENIQSYHYYMNENLFNHINIKKENVNLPNGMAENIEAECMDYDKRIDDLGGIGLQILGIGRNGHIGFNEPEDSLLVGTHEVELTGDTISVNSTLFDRAEDMPTRAVTIGMGQILKAKKIILLVNGLDKKIIMKEVFSGRISTMVPASLLQLHRDVTIIGDRDALGGI